MTPLDLAKERLGIPELARLRGWEWTPAKMCRCPYRPDKNQSGSVFSDARLFKDFASGETLDAPALLARVEELAMDAACRLFIELAGVKPGEVNRDVPVFRPRKRPPVEPPRNKPDMPSLAKPAPAHLRQIAQVRGVSVEGLSLAVQRGFLWVTRRSGSVCWALTDSARWVCQLRRIDGKPFEKADGGTYKARTCTGSRGAWPLGIIEAAAFPCIALVEGGPDFLSACHFIAAEGAAGRCAPVGMLGAGHRLPDDALPLFNGKRVRIFAHVDTPDAETGERRGLSAAARWESQLAEAGAVATTFDLAGLHRADGEPVKDLNDMAHIAAADFDADPELPCLVTF